MLRASRSYVRFNTNAPAAGQGRLANAFASAAKCTKPVTVPELAIANAKPGAPSGAAVSAIVTVLSYAGPLRGANAVSPGKRR